MSSQPQLYHFVKRITPSFMKIRERVKEGRWGEGAMWLEADCNLSSGNLLFVEFCSEQDSSGVIR